MTNENQNTFMALRDAIMEINGLKKYYTETGWYIINREGVIVVEGED